MGMVDELCNKLGQVLGRATDDLVLDQLSRLLIEWLERDTSVIEAKTQLDLNPSLADIRTLISFTGSKVASGVNIGEIAGGSYVRLQVTDERSLVSFTNATVPGGVNIGDIAGKDIIKIQFQQGIFIT